MRPTHPSHSLTMRFLWRMQALSCAHPWMHPRLQSSPFGLFLCSQSHSFPHICLLKPEFGTQSLHTPAKSILGWGVQKGEQQYLWYSLYSSCWNLASVLSSEPLKLLICPSRFPSWWMEFPKWGDLSSVTTPTQVHKSSPDSFIFFHPTQFVVIFLASFVVWDLPAFSLHSVRTVPQVDELLRYLWEEVSSMSFFLSPSSHL